MKKIFFILIFFTFNLFSYASPQIESDSLLKQTDRSEIDTNVISKLIKEAKNNYFKDLKKSKNLSLKIIELSSDLNWDKGVVDGYCLLALVYFSDSKYNKALEYNKKALKYYEKLDEKNGSMRVLCNIAMIYTNTGLYTKAMDYYNKSLILSKEMNDTISAAKINVNIGDLFMKLEDYDKARDYFNRAYDLNQKINNQKGLANNLVNLGSAYFYQDSTEKALEYYYGSLDMRNELEIDRGTSKLLSNIGMVYLQKNEFSKAIDYFYKAMKISKNNEEEKEIANIFENIGETYLRMAQNIKKNTISDVKLKKKYLQRAEKNINDATKIFIDIGEMNNLMNSYLLLSEVYGEMKEFDKAYDTFRDYMLIKDSLLSVETKTRIANLDAVRQNELKDAEIKMLNKDKEYAQKQKRIIIIASLLGIFMLLALAYVLYRRYKFKEQAERLLQEKNQEISVAHQRITDSITYASGIQAAVLPFDTRIGQFLKEYFILLIPKDIVSGDFYWIEKVDGKIFLVVADCTGHGVPGAFMSMIGNEMLNNIIIKQKMYDPAGILALMHKDVRYALKQDEASSSTHDGMDVCICVIEGDNLTFAGAKRPLYYVQNNEFHEIKGDRKSIGGRQKEEERLFTNHEISIDSETMLYLTTDGYQDQHNINQEKFGVKRFRELLFSISDKSMQEQKEILAKTLEEFSEGEKNRDDIAVLGIKT